MAGLLDALKVKGLTLRNRIVMPPMNTEFASEEGAVTDRLVEHYVRRSKAIGLMIVEHSYVSPEGKLSKKQLGIYDDKLVSGLTTLAQSAHANGTPVIVQINHAGRRTTQDIIGTKPVAPSATEDARELRIEEMEELKETFAEAAERAMRSGFDGVEVHGAHGFLLNQFFSPLANKRTDKYGGSLGNRVRFPLEVVERVKETIGERLLLYRLGSDDLDPAGTRIEDSQKFAVRLQEAGVDIIDVSGGMCGSRPAQFQGKQGYFISQASRIRKAVDVPIIGVGGITEPEYADSLVRDGKVDLVAVGRELVRQPDWVVHAIQVLESRQGHGRKSRGRKTHLFDPKDVEVLEAEDRKLWQNPQEILATIDVRPSYVACDLGCGSGFYTVPLAKKAKEVYAVDAQEEMLKILEEKIRKLKLSNVTPLLSKDDEIPLEDKSLDLLVSVNTLHEFGDKEGMISEMCRVLRPRGTALIVDFKKEDTGFGPPVSIRVSDKRTIRLFEKKSFVVEKAKKLPYHYLLVFVKKT